jgi:hypothetical protein
MTTDKGWALKIRKWHYGKLIILWAWCGTSSVIFLSNLTARVARKEALNAPIVSFVELFLSVLMLAAPSVVTWVWLGGREQG